MRVKEPPHLVAEPGPPASGPADDGIHAQLAHELGKRRTQDELAALGSHRFGTHPGQPIIGAGCRKGSLVVSPQPIMI